MKIKLLLVILSIGFLLVGCEQNDKKVKEKNEDYKSTISIKYEDGKYKITTTIQYVGEKESVEVSYGDGYFNKYIKNDMGEIIGNIDGRAPLHITTINKGKIIVREDVVPDYVLKEMKLGETYEIEAVADFKENGSNETEGKINITIAATFDYKEVADNEIYSTNELKVFMDKIMESKEEFISNITYFQITIKPQELEIRKQPEIIWLQINKASTKLNSEELTDLIEEKIEVSRELFRVDLVDEKSEYKPTKVPY